MRLRHGKIWSTSAISTHGRREPLNSPRRPSVLTQLVGERLEQTTFPLEHFAHSGSRHSLEVKRLEVNRTPAFAAEAVPHPRRHIANSFLFSTASCMRPNGQSTIIVSNACFSPDFWGSRFSDLSFPACERERSPPALLRLTSRPLIGICNGK
ncbi:hypothetical protein BU26DRAFT_32556 [Trematosphaeria pertusa]|uniref:Uncharacterized protein n=1 Tax=Trematosphaeria pertusa TaxID=390896 RepID=A0A6A6J3L9_9PLEO|nr:uncharacterized protein BU26DRAFT_32556 [Trematosphaeria pertusa]KAF2256947.1 hypothetical protein BU26DRAFT_32556 [Trematosphaeria pertusa]